MAGVAGAFLPWITVEVRSYAGIHGPQGWASVVFGVILVVCAGVGLRKRRLPGGWAVGAGAAALVLLGLGVWGIVAVKASASAMSSVLAEGAGSSGLGTGPGVWVIALAGLAGLVATGLARRR